MNTPTLELYRRRVDLTIIVEQHIVAARPTTCRRITVTIHDDTIILIQAVKAKATIILIATLHTGRTEPGTQPTQYGIHFLLPLVPS